MSHLERNVTPSRLRQDLLAAIMIAMLGVVLLAISWVGIATASHRERSASGIVPIGQIGPMVTVAFDNVQINQSLVDNGTATFNGTNTFAGATTFNNSLTVTKGITGLGNAVYGTGQDGPANCFDGATTCLGFAPSSSVYTLTRSIFPSSMTVSVGATVKLNNFYIQDSGLLANNGTISNNGNAGALGVAGAATATQWYIATLAGGAGGTNAAGSLGSAAPNAFPTIWGTAGTPGSGTATTGGLGGACAGGGGGGSTNAGGSGGSVTQPSNAASNIPIYMGFLTDRIGQALGTSWSGGSGGGGGGATTSGTGGGGGAGGGAAFVIAQTITGTGTISADGGAGAAGSGTGGAGGGGGGGGGVVLVIYNTMSAGQSVHANGGTHGAGANGGGNGGDGGNCFAFKLNLSGDGT